jgi:hypothetical protein
MPRGRQLQRALHPGRTRQRLLALCAVAGGSLTAVPAIAAARTYYVSPRGSDASSGRSPWRPWRSVYRVNKARLKPGDTVLFQAGATFSDHTLMPGWGVRVSGARKRPVTFGSYGRGRANLPKGIWIKGERHLVFENFNLGPEQAVNGTGSFDTVQNCTMTNLLGAVKLAVNVIGSHWLIRGNWINRTGDSGMLLRGSAFTVVGNVIANTGLEPVGYATHGIYLKASGSKVFWNTITGFHDDGVSVRYRNSTVEDNNISWGKFGVAFFEWDTRTGHTRIVGNKISNTSVAGIYVSPWDVGGATHENIAIKRNIIYRYGGLSAKAARATSWRAISLSKNKGRYRVHGNRVLS